MLGLISLSSSAKQLQAARNLAEHLAQSLDIPLSVRLWDGSMVQLGQSARPEMYVSLGGPGVVGSLLRRPTLENLVRHYAAGRIDFHGGNLVDFATAARSPHFRQRFKSLRKWPLVRNLLHFLFAPSDKFEVQHGFAGDPSSRPLPERHDRDCIQFHYDVGNEFYQLFLDPEMQYSCAYFTDWGNSLEQAQRDKLEMICRRLRLKPGESFLDIGCGWGGLICYAAQHFGVQAHGVTLSQAQFDFTSAKIRGLGLEDRVTVELRDYRTLEGTYDKISSIEMYEHVGIVNFPTYFGKINSLLRDRGLLLNQGTTLRVKPAKTFRKMPSIQRLIGKYIFPGGELDHIGHTVEALEARRFEVHDVENWREHFARTTELWCRRLSARRDEAIALIGPERYRLWVAYLAACAHYFHDGGIRIYQVLASKHSGKGPAELPPTRGDLYRNETASPNPLEE
jgi:cyclopropane-fatty-acyl-phospholipid synthase